MFLSLKHLIPFEKINKKNQKTLKLYFQLIDCEITVIFSSKNYELLYWKKGEGKDNIPITRIS